MTAGAPGIVYVAGYGRSGSTLLDVVLGAHPDIAGLGEVGLLWRQLAQPGGECACGAPLPDCPRWGPALRALGARFELGALEAQSQRQEAWRGGGTPGHGDYGPAMAALFADVAAREGARLLVDSSKTSYRFARRPVALHRAAGLGVRQLHLVRDPRAVLASCLKGQNSRLAVGDDRVRTFATPIALAGWVASNVAALWNARRLGPGSTLVVEYEALVSRPREALARIGAFLGVDLAGVATRIEAGEAFDAGHVVAGNRMARAGGVVPHVLPPEPSLGAWRRLACAVLAAPLHAWLRRRARQPVRAA